MTAFSKTLMVTSIAIIGYIISSLPACRISFLARMLFLGSGYACSSGYMHQFVNVPAPSRHLPGRTCEVTSRVSADRLRHTATSPSFPYHTVMSCWCLFAALRSCCCSMGATNEIKLKYVLCATGRSYFRLKAANSVAFLPSKIGVSTPSGIFH